MLGEPGPDDLLRRAAAVHVGRVDEVAAGGEVGVEQVVRRRLVCLRTERHGAQRVGRDDCTGVSECAVAHGENALREVFAGLVENCDGGLLPHRTPSSITRPAAMTTTAQGVAVPVSSAGAPVRLPIHRSSRLSGIGRPSR